VRADSAFFSAKLVTAIRAAGACYSITVANTKTIRAAIATIPETAWKPIKYRNAVRDADEGRRISEAEIAEIPYTAFTSKKAELHTRGRLIVRRIRRLNPATVPDGQGELFAAHRHHAFHTTNPLVIDQTEPMHRLRDVVRAIAQRAVARHLRPQPSGQLRRRPRPAAPGRTPRRRGRRSGPHHNRPAAPQRTVRLQPGQRKRNTKTAAESPNPCSTCPRPSRPAEPDAGAGATSLQRFDPSAPLGTVMRRCRNAVRP
jgi:hypothetical protein